MPSAARALKRALIVLLTTVIRCAPFNAGKATGSSGPWDRARRAALTAARRSPGVMSSGRRCPVMTSSAYAQLQKYLLSAIGPLASPRGGAQNCSIAASPAGTLAGVFAVSQNQFASTLEPATKV